MDKTEYIDKEKVLQICFEALPACWYEVMEQKIEEMEVEFVMAQGAGKPRW